MTFFGPNGVVTLNVTKPQQQGASPQTQMTGGTMTRGNMTRGNMTGSNMTVGNLTSGKIPEGMENIVMWI